MTLARLVGSRKACLVLSFVVNVLPFAIVIAAVCMGKLHPLYLLTFLALPRAVWLCASLVRFYNGNAAVPPVPPRWLGPMVKEWDKVREAGFDWFLMRWMTARNILSAFCLAIIVAKILLLIF